MKYLKFLLLGTIFGIILAKAEVISWYRIYEMFQFDSFHMYGIIGSAVVLGILGVYIMKRQEMKTLNDEPIIFQSKDKKFIRYIVGGILFGLGWALVGACPGPMFILLGYGYLSIVVVIIGALIGTLVYGIMRNHLPH